MNENLDNLPESYGPSVETEVPTEFKQQEKLEAVHPALAQEQYQEEPEAEQEAPAEPVLQTGRKPKQDEIKNMAAMRLQIAQLKKERDDAMRLANEKNDRILGDDDIAEGKDINKMQRKLQALEAELIQTRIKAQYHDFDSVVTVDNLAVLRDSYPELAATLQTSPDLYTQASSAYTLIKKLGIAPDQQQLAQQERVKANSYKPRPASSVGAQQGESPLTRANAFAEGLTDDLSKQLWKEMNQYRKGY